MLPCVLINPTSEAAIHLSTPVSFPVITSSPRRLVLLFQLKEEDASINPSLLLPFFQPDVVLERAAGTARPVVFHPANQLGSLRDDSEREAEGELWSLDGEGKS